MPTLDFKGKQFVYAHHLGVAYRTLEVDAKKSVLPKSKKGEKSAKSAKNAEADGNLIIHGDNLEALKALLPRYGGRVNCIYIDPPYNTGNEGWCYNDNVNAPLMKRWLKDNGEVDREDMERHDKWLCMMWPRLQLLRDLLAEDGVIFISIDDNEHHHLRTIMDEIFGEGNFIASFLWKKKGTSTNVKGTTVSAVADYQLCYCKSNMESISPRITLKESRKYPLKDDLGNYRLEIIEKKNDGIYERETMQYKIIGQHPRKGKRWQIGQDTALKLEDKNRFIIDKGIVKIKIYDFEDKDTKSANPTYLPENCGSSDSANKDLINILEKNNFENPKPYGLIFYLINLINNKNSIILDSFAGSGTTAQAVLELNKEDGGNRKFILVECEKYADKITAERVRRVIKGVPKAKDANLKKGLGGSFAFCKLGEAMDLENLISGKKLPDYDSLARYIAHTAAGVSLPKIVKGKDWFFGESEQFRMHLIYKPDKKFLASKESALTGELAEGISKSAGKGKAAKTILVFAPWKFMSQKELTSHGITFCQLPYAIHRLYGDEMEAV